MGAIEKINDKTSCVHGDLNELCKPKNPFLLFLILPKDSMLYFKDLTLVFPLDWDQWLDFNPLQKLNWQGQSEEDIFKEICDSCNPVVGWLFVYSDCTVGLRTVLKRLYVLFVFFWGIDKEECQTFNHASERPEEKCDELVQDEFVDDLVIEVYCANFGYDDKQGKQANRDLEALGDRIILIYDIVGTI